MDPSPAFVYLPTTPPVAHIQAGRTALATAPPVPNPALGALSQLEGAWVGTGFNTIWRPNQASSGSDHFLEVNTTTEQLDFDLISGAIPNRGVEGDLVTTGVRYLQQSSDANVHDPTTGLSAGLHIEPGLWLSIGPTTNPDLPATVARLASIPHGATIVAQGPMLTSAGAPRIGPVSITPFEINDPGALHAFPNEQNLANRSDFRTRGIGLTGVTQAMLDNPNSVLTSVAHAGITATTTLSVSSSATLPAQGGGTANTAFLQGGAAGSNATAAQVTATFWLQTRHGCAEPDLLQYSQTVLLNFSGLSWPHVTVATLRKPL